MRAVKDFSTAEAARRAGVNMNTIYRRVVTGRLEAEKIDGNWRVKASALKNYIAERNAQTARAIQRMNDRAADAERASCMPNSPPAA